MENFKINEILLTGEVQNVIEKFHKSKPSPQLFNYYVQNKKLVPFFTRNRISFWYTDHVKRAVAKLPAVSATEAQIEKEIQKEIRKRKFNLLGK